VACDASQPLKVKDPDIAPPSEINNPASLPFLSAGTLTDFAVAFIGASDQLNNAHEGIASMGAIFTDEFTDYDTYTTRNALNNRVAVAANANLAAVYQNLGQAHNDALRAVSAYTKFAPSTVDRAEMYAIDAYIYMLVAEHWCSGEPFSTIDVATGNVTNNPFLTTTQMLDTALTELQQAKLVAASDKEATQQRVASVTGLAQAGAARALLDLGQVAAAAESAAAVQSGFACQIFASSNTPRQNNGIWFYTISFNAFSVGERKNGTGLPFQSDTDPRVPWTAPPGLTGSNGGGPFIIQEKYQSSSTPVTLADYTEAQLIVAEGDLFAGNYAGALQIMNALRASSGLTWAARDALATNSVRARLLDVCDRPPPGRLAADAALPIQRRPVRLRDRRRLPGRRQPIDYARISDTPAHQPEPQLQGLRPDYTMT
jgi:hypothetical protein